MNKLKRSEKFCPSCKSKNPIRTFNCKQCNYAFPQKDNPNKKPKKDKSKKLNECFLDLKAEKASAENKFSLNKKVEIFEQNDGINKKILSKYLEENLKNKNSFKSLDISKKSQLSDHFVLSMGKDEIEISINDYEPCENLCYDFTKHYSNSNLLGAIAYVSLKLNKIILSVFEFADRSNQIKSDPNNFIPKNEFQMICGNSIVIDNDDFDINRFSLKLVNSTPIILLARNNHLYIYLHDKLSGINQLHKIKFKEFINMFDCIISSDNYIKIITADYNNTIFLHVLPIAENSINKLSVFDVSLSLIYEKQFSNKITDLKFLPFSEEINQYQLKNFFCASSREGLTKFFDTLNPLSYSFKHKTSELWISKFSYDKRNNILYYMTNVGEKIHGIKFFTDELKDPLVKKIPNTENSIYFFKEDLTDRLYFQDKKGKINYVDSVNINEMFVKYKKKIKYNIKVYDFYDNKENESNQSATEQDEKSESDSSSKSECELELGSESDSEKTMEVYDEKSQLEENNQFFTKFSILAFPNKETKEIKNLLILPCLDKIIVKILIKK